MKFMEKIDFSPAYQGAVSDSDTLVSSRQNKAAFNTTTWLREELKHLRGWINTIRTALLGLSPEETPLFPPVKPVHALTRSDSRQDRNAPTAFNDKKMPWVKANHSLQHHAYLTINRLIANRQSLAGQSILCVGGRAALYPEYHRLIEAAGGHFMVYRGGAQSNTNCLLALLDCIGMVICPADCINHEDFFTVKQYCQRTGKYCAILERSNLATFGKAVEILARNCCRHVESSTTPQAAY